MKKFIILTMVTMIFLLVFVAGGLAKPVDKINEKFDYGPFAVWNPCTLEVVWLIGTVHINGQLLYDSAGGVHGKIHADCHFVSDDDTPGTEYIANGTLNFQVDEVVTLTEFEGTGILKLTCISKGEELNFIFKARVYKIEVGINWLKIYWDEVDDVCTGKQP
jgi:hypothetical protein